eukprot:2814471-Pyramimonas_sp.AAC.1
MTKATDSFKGSLEGATAPEWKTFQDNCQLEDIQKAWADAKVQTKQLDAAISELQKDRIHRA